MSTADFLEQQAEVDYDAGRRLIHEIEKRELELVNMRGDRDDLFRRAAEMRVAANILREVGLRSETLNNAPFVAVDSPIARPTEGPTPRPEQDPQRAGTPLLEETPAQPRSPGAVPPISDRG